MTRRESILISMTALVVVAGASYIYVAEPVALAWSSLRAEASELTIERDRLQDIVENREQIQRRVAEYEGSVRVGASLEELEVILLQEVESLASSTGLRVGNIKPLSRVDAGQFNRLAVELHARCMGHEFVKFLQALQRPDHLINADRITIVVGNERPPLAVTVALTKLVRTEETGK